MLPRASETGNLTSGGAARLGASTSGLHPSAPVLAFVGRKPGVGRPFVRFLVLALAHGNLKSKLVVGQHKHPSAPVLAFVGRKLGRC